LVALVVSPQLAFAEAAAGDTHARYMRALDRMMVGLSAENARASATVKREYRAYLDHLVLDEFASLEDALYTGGLVPLPANHEQLNIVVRTNGASPIAEKDLDNQTSYIAARPAAVGALLDIASRVKSGPLEITSMVRHTEYQDALRTTNMNANTSVPMHTMGLAFDIALVNSPLATSTKRGTYCARCSRPVTSCSSASGSSSCSTSSRIHRASVITRTSTHERCRARCQRMAVSPARRSRLRRWRSRR
jgi:hypothetical protein